jgi:TATA-binding protein-associated factor
MRRTKDLVLAELPPKIISDVLCPISEEQRDLYTSFMRSSDATEDDLEKAVSSTAEQSSMPDPLRAILYLRLLCVHPALVLPSSRAQSAFKEKLLKNIDCAPKLLMLARLLLERGVVARTECTEPRLIFDSALTREEAEDAAAVGSDSASSEEDEESEAIEGTGIDSRSKRALVFAQHRCVLDVIERCLMQRFFPGTKLATAVYVLTTHTMSAVKYVRMDGSTPAGIRGQIAQRSLSPHTLLCALQNIAVSPRLRLFLKWMLPPGQMSCAKQARTNFHGSCS